jgi:membrane protein DedA with SNARE-associated domain
MQMSLWRFVAIDTLASLIFVPALGIVGYVFTDQVYLIDTWFQHTGRVIGALIVVACVGWLCRHFWEKRKRSTTGIPP